MGLVCQTNSKWTVSLVRPFSWLFRDRRENDNHVCALHSAAGVVGAPVGCIQTESSLRETSGLTFF